MTMEKKIQELCFYYGCYSSCGAGWAPFCVIIDQSAKVS